MFTTNPRIADPTYAPDPNPGPAARFASKLILDPRDLPFVSLIAQCTFFVLPLAALLYALGDFHWALGAGYLAWVALGFVDRYTLMLHNTSHRPLFRPRFRLLNGYVPVVLGPFFGQSPHTYFGHHLGMHHPENNLEGDLSSTMRFRRDSFPDFLRYFARFFFLGALEMPLYLWRKGRRRLAVRAALGEAGFYAAVVALSFWNLRATLVVFVLPFVFMRFMMMAGNWAQHAFIDPASPASPFANSITCVNTRYNRRCFNDGYHIGHHVKSNRHWSELPGDFEKNAGRYADEGAIVFEGLDFFQVWALLMLRRYDVLAARVVQLGRADKSAGEITLLLRARTRPAS